MAFFVLGCYCCQCIPLLSCRYQLTLICDEKQSGRHTQAMAMLLSNGFCRMWPSLHSSSLMVAIWFLDANSSYAAMTVTEDQLGSGKVIGGLTALIAQSRCAVVSFFIPIRSAMPRCIAPKSKSLKSLLVAGVVLPCSFGSGRTAQKSLVSMFCWAFGFWQRREAFGEGEHFWHGEGFWSVTYEDSSVFGSVRITRLKCSCCKSLTLCNSSNGLMASWNCLMLKASLTPKMMPEKFKSD